MALKLVPLPGESVLGEEPVPAARHAYRFGFVVTREAVYVPVRRRGFAITESHEARRIPSGDIVQVRLAPAPRLTIKSAWSLGVSVFLFFTFWESFYRKGHYSPLLLVAIGAGLARPLIELLLGATGRYSLTITTRDETLRYGPENNHTLLPSAKARALAAQKAFLRACRSAGLSVDPPDPALEPQSL